MNNWLYTGHVYHKRFSIQQHSFTNRIFYIRFPLSRAQDLKNMFFSLDRWNLLSFYRKDHGDRQGGDLWKWALEKLILNGVGNAITKIELQTFPRVLGFVFNPVSFWFCYSGEHLVATIAEVNNTFGETHSYILKPNETEKEKVLHVSPFFKISGSYVFIFKNQNNQDIAIINYRRNDSILLHAQIIGKPQNWTAWNLFRTWLSYPFMTLAVVFYIHLHALILYFKGVPFFGKKGKEEAL
jgi:DUF1365 family protein